MKGETCGGDERRTHQHVHAEFSSSSCMPSESTVQCVHQLPFLWTSADVERCQHHPFVRPTDIPLETNEGTKGQAKEMEVEIGTLVLKIQRLGSQEMAE